MWTPPSRRCYNKPKHCLLHGRLKEFSTESPSKRSRISYGQNLAVLERLRMQPMPFGENGGSKDKDRARRAHGAKRRSLGNHALVRARGKAP